MYHTIPAGPTVSPIAAQLPVVFLLLLSKGAPVIAVSPRVLFPRRTTGTSAFFKAGTGHFPPQRLLKSTLTPEERQEMGRKLQQLKDTRKTKM